MNGLAENDMGTEITIKDAAASGNKPGAAFLEEGILHRIYKKKISGFTIMR